MNKVIIHGNLGADPETRTGQSGSVVANFRVATRERVKKGDEWVDHTEWISVVAFGRTAENVRGRTPAGGADRRSTARRLTTI